ncbi:hypothetical protein GPY51_15640 [Photorhabdus laumondii subsp. laumondii]|uniref:Photorhabdus luminescens subsp. laumondii TTO1 complete genome segment 15/17 n=4 Tax=Photorhabdus TaxID=29487 RepID=Q7MZK6_PHOLL|nr:MULTISPECIES: hypothetical protein [Photorhabdus]AKH62252.1 hypothetical protein VY86_01685 [Photorhabdus thracensis]AWK43842.1 hypothetical protein A4R40_21215 [Photorhabdus laumondii subsp. laumondii]AXG44518.1 hypothetical protein PluDJC_21165 [Photorhabdus laumondii subsp. laumondii]AXG49147.1 hypothetical protein PluTT01m_21865 [Photorhabdus laumondii subsp. laumondii]KTL62087.1 hypothetical protein AA106_07005 [Photorhabdus laumondii subsp. laumondii]
MKTISGFDQLLSLYKQLPDVGWIYIDKDFDTESTQDILNKNYYLAENDDEEFDMDETHGTFLECPMFADIIDNKLEHNPNAIKEDLIEAVIHYLVYDDFLD